MKKILFLLFIFINIKLFSIDIELPDNWWTLKEEEIEKKINMGKNKIKIFLGYSDSGLNFNESTAIENANLNGYQNITNIISNKMKNISNSKEFDIYLNKLKEKYNLTNNDKKNIIETINSIDKVSFQLSGIMQLSNYVEEKDNKYVGWVCLGTNIENYINNIINNLNSILVKKFSDKKNKDFINNIGLYFKDKL